MWLAMRYRAVDVARDGTCEVVWSCVHDPVYTTGRRGVDNRRSRMLPASLLQTDRGGETTYHGPGQIMLYPVVHLGRRRIGVKAYVHLLEQSCLELLAGFGVGAWRRDGFPGVWTDKGKIAALGVKVTRAVAYHGMALNRDVPRQWFDAIEPCGLKLPVANLNDFIHIDLDDADLAARWASCLQSLL